jgi:hypothetical protein
MAQLNAQVFKDNYPEISGRRYLTRASRPVRKESGRADHSAENKRILEGMVPQP